MFLILTIGCRLCYGNTFNVSGRIRALLGGSRTNCEPFHSQDLISNSPDCLLKNLVILVLRIWYWTNQWSSTDVFLYSRLKNDKILKEAYWSVERFKNDLWKLNIVPLELSFSPEVFAIAVMLWRPKMSRLHPGLGNTWDPSSSKSWIVKWNISWENVCSRRPKN